MKRDMDLCREILQRLEEAGPPQERLDIEIEGRAPEEISYHIKLLTKLGSSKRGMSRT